MTQSQDSSVENNFTKGLITESTGLNFPENAATDTDNCEYTIVGDVKRRLGINNELNNSTKIVDRTNKAISTYKWNNAGGDGVSQIVAKQIGPTLYFYLSNAATVSVPLSQNLLGSTVDISSFVASGGTFDNSLECQFADGNGYLFVFHPSCDPIYCTYASGAVTGNSIALKVRDIGGIPEVGVADNLRPLTLTNEHKYNLINQGWISGNPWIGTSTTSNTYSTGAKTFTIATGLTGVVGGQSITIKSLSTSYLIGTVTSYTSGTGALIVSITSFSLAFGDPNPNSNWTITPANTGYINTWFTALGNYPSNSDQWWNFKNSSDVFDPATTQANTTLGSGPAPKGSIILNAFQQQRSALSGVASITDVTTTVRPRTGAWYQGRVWYSGVDASFSATGDEPFSTWTETIYFSQIITNSSQFGNCYQQNDLTSEVLFDLLPTDGGTVRIQGCGPIYKLFPIQNGLLVFAANGIWFITGNQGVGFTANDFTIMDMPKIKSISGSSFVNVNGLPYFWNEEGIYAVQPAKTGGLTVEPLTVGTILNFYNSIPVSSKKYVRGAYHPIDYVIQWIYRDTETPDVTGRYTYNKILNFNTYNKAFYPYTVDTSVNSINSITYVDYPGGSTAPDPDFKYSASAGTAHTFAEEYATNYVDWGSINYVSYFVTGYKLRGNAIKKFQPQYIQVYSRMNDAACAYKIQGIWDYANDRNSGRWSTIQLINIALAKFDTIFRRHKIRGHGFALQFKFSSADGQPFDIQGWAIIDTVNAGA